MQRQRDPFCCTRALQHRPGLFKYLPRRGQIRHKHIGLQRGDTLFQLLTLSGMACNQLPSLIHSTLCRAQRRLSRKRRKRRRHQDRPQAYPEDTHRRHQPAPTGDIGSRQQLGQRADWCRSLISQAVGKEVANALLDQGILHLDALGPVKFTDLLGHPQAMPGQVQLFLQFGLAETHLVDQRHGPHLLGEGDNVAHFRSPFAGAR